MWWLSVHTYVKQPQKTINYEVWNEHSFVWLVGVSTCGTSLIISVQVGPTDSFARTPIQMMTVMKTSPAVLSSSGESHENLSRSCLGHILLHKPKGGIKVYYYYYYIVFMYSKRIVYFKSGFLALWFLSQSSMFSSCHYHNVNIINHY